MVIGSIYALFTIGIKSFNRGSDKFDLTQNMRIGMEKITRELRETNQITTALPPDDTNPSNPPTSEICFRDANYDQIRYITYYLSGTDLNRKITHYYKSDPNVWVDQEESGIKTEIIDEDVIISKNIDTLKFFGFSVITIEMSGSLNQENINLLTEVTPRNI